MKSVFQMDGPLFRFLNRIADLVILNILCILTSLGIVTIGASFTSLYYVCMKMARREDGYVVKDYFKAFKQNFKQATVLTIFFEVIFIILAADYYLLFQVLPLQNESFAALMNGAGREYIKLPIYLLLIICISLCEFVFPILARFDSTPKRTVRNAFFMIVQNFGWFLLITVVNFLLIIMLLGQTSLFIKLSFLWFILGISLPAFINAHIFKMIFVKYE